MWHATNQGENLPHPKVEAYDFQQLLPNVWSASAWNPTTEAKSSYRRPPVRQEMPDKIQ